VLKKDLSIGEHFRAFFSKSEGCWNWIGGKDKDGYGHFRHASHQYRAPRLAWMLAKGPIPSGSLVLHRCDNPSCVRPSHLFIGSRKDNSRDMIEKGRWISPTTKLGPDEIRDIRSRDRNGRHFIRDLAQEFGVSISAVYKVVTGDSWKDVQ